MSQFQRFGDIEPHEITMRSSGSLSSSRRVAAVTSVGGLAVELAMRRGALTWSIRNAAPDDATIETVSLVFPLGTLPNGTRMLRNGLQSWSATDVALLGTSQDPSIGSATAEEVRGSFHADPRVVAHPLELRSEWFTVIAPYGEPALLVGFGGDACHDGTLRIRPSSESGYELVVEAYLGGALVRAGERLPLGEVRWEFGEPAAILRAWAVQTGNAGRARVHAPHSIGFCSWYRYFSEVTEADMRKNLAVARTLPLHIVQLDDGYQSTIGDWLVTNTRFPSGLPDFAARAREAERVPGIWIAPFLVAPDSRVAHEHPEWIAKRTDGSPHIGMWNPVWDGGMGGLMFTLDTTRVDVQEHLAHIARRLVDVGFGYLKLDFTYAPRLPGMFHDASATPFERVRHGFEAIRRGAGEKVHLVGCGAPLAASLGVIDAMRIGSDVSPTWEVEVPTRGDLPCGATDLPGYEATQPSTRNALRNTVLRSFMHRTLWANDPDCVMLRRTKTKLTPTQIATWARTVALSGGAFFVSDDLALLGREELDELHAFVARSHVADEEARAGRGARAEDLPTEREPLRLVTSSGTLDVKLATGQSAMLEPSR